MTPADFDAIWLTLKLASLTTVLLLLIGTPIAWWLARTRHWAKGPVGAVVTLPLVLPPAVLGFYLLVLMGPDGPVGQFTQSLGLGLLPAADERFGFLRPGTDALQATLQRPLRRLGKGRRSQPVARPERAVAQCQLAELLQQRPQVGKARRRCGAAARLQLHRAGGGQRRQRQRGVVARHQQLEPARGLRAHHGATPPRGKAARRTSSPRRRSHSSADSAR